MSEKFIVLKPTAPMRVANASLRIRQGQAVRHPPYPVAEDVFDVFNNIEDANKAAAKNAELKNEATRHGITNMKSLAKALKKSAAEPTAEERRKVIENAKVLTPDGLLDPLADKRLQDLEAEKQRLESELEELKKKQEKVNPDAYLDQNSRAVVKGIKKAAKKGQLKKEDVQTIIEAEKKGRKRKTVLDKLVSMAKEDGFFGKFFK